MSAGFLLDTNAVSELNRRRPDQNVVRWFRGHRTDQCFVSVLVIGEIAQGIERLRPKDGARAERHASWLDGLIRLYSSRILPVSQPVAEEWGRVQGRPGPPPQIDGLIAATAAVNGLTVVTRNVADFARAGVPVLNPFEPA